VKHICMYNITTTIKIGGIETFYWEVAKEFQKQGYDVELVSGKGDYIKYEDIPLKQFSFTSREKILDLGNRFRKWGERISFFRRAWPYLKRQNYDIFFIHKPLDFFTAYFIKKHSPKTTTVFMSGGEDFYGFDRFFAKYVDHMFAVSKENAKIISARYHREVPVVSNGVDIDKFRPMPEAREELRKRFGIEEDTVLISVGRIVGWKGFQLVIEALKELPDMHYVLIGDGPYLAELKALVNKFNIEDRVSFLGAIDNLELPVYLNMGDVFIQPSIGHEAFGITLIEAMACGLPVVASYNGGMKDIVIEGKNGGFFEIKNKKELQEVLQKIINLKDKLYPREYVIQNFKWQHTVQQILKYVDKR